MSFIYISSSSTFPSHTSLLRLHPPITPYLRYAPITLTISLHYTTLHYTTLHFTTLHYYTDRLEKEKKDIEKAKRKARAERRKAGKDSSSEDEPEPESPYSKDYNIHRWCGRTCMRLFEVTKQHYHLEAAYTHYQRSIECMSVPRPGYDMSTIIRLPTVLFELGQLYEHFGSHEAALQMYTKIMGKYNIVKSIITVRCLAMLCYLAISL